MQCLWDHWDCIKQTVVCKHMPKVCPDDTEHLHCSLLVDSAVSHQFCKWMLNDQVAKADVFARSIHNICFLGETRNIRSRWLSWMHVRLVIRRLRVQPPPGRQHSFVEIWSWNIFYGHSLLSAKSRRASVSSERMCTILVNRLED